MRKKVGMVAAIAGLGFFACGASAAVLSWDFTVHPTQEAVPMIGYANGAVWDGGLGNTPYGEAAGGALQGDGTAIFADSPAESSNSGFVIGGDTGAFTFDMRVKVLESVTGDARGKSVSFRDSTGRGRGLALNADGLALKDGSGTVRGYGPIAMTEWQIIRNVLTGLDTGGGVYVVTTYLWDAGGSFWIHLGDQGLGGSGYAGEIVAGGIGIGSLAGSSTNAGKFQIDWARVDTENALGPEVPPLVPEPTALALLTIGAMPLLRRRR